MEAKYCSNCGAELKEGADVCTNCGKFVQHQHIYRVDNRSIIELYKDALRKYATFDGRATLREYWLFVVANILVYIVSFFILIAMAISFGVSYYNTNRVAPFLFFIFGLYALVFYIFYPLAMLIPSIAISVRRLHDQNKSGYFWFINLIPGIGGIIFLVLMAWPGDEGSNDFGPHPLER